MNLKPNGRYIHFILSVLSAGHIVILDVKGGRNREMIIAKKIFLYNDQGLILIMYFFTKMERNFVSCMYRCTESLYV